jgi:transcriptional regulator with XRE-family HTH domain
MCQKLEKSPMKLTADIREQLGLSHREIARFIGAERSIVARSEIGSRQLHADARMHLQALHEALTSIPEALTTPAISSAFEMELKAHLQKCQHKLHIMKKKLNTMEQRFMQCTKLMYSLQQLNTNKYLNTRQQRWIEEQQHQVQKKLNNSSYEQQMLLRLEIQVLEAEAGIYEKAIASL